MIVVVEHVAKTAPRCFTGTPLEDPGLFTAEPCWNMGKAKSQTRPHTPLALAERLRSQPL